MSRKKICPPAEFAAAEEIAGCEDLVLEILTRMPAKSLLRSKLVSKQWQSLISDPQFIRNHTRKNPNKTPSGLYFYDSLTASQSVNSVSLNQTSTPFLGRFNGTMKFTQSCNGLLLCRFTSPEDAEFFCVINPTNSSFKVLPPPEMTQKESSVSGVSLIFDPSVSIHYKVICFRRPTRRYSSTYQIDIYSSEDHSWRTLFHAYEPRCYVVKFESGVYCNGFVYWVTEGYSSLRFDVSSETFIRYEMPIMPESDRRGSCRYFGQCGGYVHFIKICHPSAKKFCVLELNRDCSKWVIKYRVSVCRLVHAFPEVVRKSLERFTNGETVYAFSVLHVLRGEKEEDSELVMTIPGKVISYNFVKKTVKALRDLPDGEIIEPLKFNPVSSYQFVETLVKV